jgi:peptidoglycan/xylan/chitin deacetylase (PgdA/CDA1 family)
MMKKAWLTTSWDDGHPLDFKIADLLCRYGLTGTFYIPKSAPTGAMSPAQIRDLGSAFEIGSHTINHVFLDTADDAQARKEIVESKAWMENCLGRPCPMFCPPGGKFSSRDIELIRDAGYSALRSVELLSVDPPRDLGRGLKLLPTTVHAFPQPFKAYVKNAIKRRRLGNLWLYILHGRSNQWVRLAESLISHVAENGGVFHLWGHSWELQEKRQWERLETVLRLMGEHTDKAPCLTNGDLVISASPLSASEIASFSRRV